MYWKLFGIVTNRDSAVPVVLESGPGMRKGVTRKSSPSAGEIRFGAFEFGPETGELRKHGLRIKLRGQPIEVLTMLLQHPGKMVTREELQRGLWPADAYVDFEQSLNAAKQKGLGEAFDLIVRPFDIPGPRF